MKFSLCFFSILVVFVYFGYPIVLYIFSLLKRKKFKREDIFPTVEIIIPAHNEEKVIGKKMESCLNLDYPKEKLKITVILDGCTDNTEKIILEKFKDYVKLINFKTQKGKVAGLNKAVENSNAEVIFFNDADVFCDKNSLKILISNLKDKEVGCVGGRLIFEIDRQGTVTEKGESLYWRYETNLRKLESSMGLLLVVSGSFYILRRKLYSSIDENCSDDFLNPIQTVSKKYRVIYDIEAKAYAKIPKTPDEEFKQKVRMISQALMATRVYWKKILKTNSIFIFEFLFHKLLRWCISGFLILIFLLNLFLVKEQFFLILFIFQIIFYFFAFLGYSMQKRQWHMPLLVSIAFYFCLVNMASLVAFYKFIAKKQIGIWEKPKTAR